MGMTEDHRQPLTEQRRLVQRIVSGRIPSAREFDACRKLLTSGCDEEATFAALFTLLQGALADPFLPIDDTRMVVPILKGMARGELTAGDLL
jgi:hypothetical protein